jgi:fucose permease
MWTYVGIQGIIDYFWTDIIHGINIDPGFDSLSVARAIFTFGRLVAAGLCFVGIPPRIVIGVCIVGAFVTALLALVLPSGNGPLAMLLLYHFFEGPVFPTLFAMIMRGQGRHTKFAATATVMTIGVGTIWPTVVYGFERLHPTDSRAALLIITILFGLLMIWPTMICSRRVLRRWVDPKWSKPKVTATTTPSHGADRDVRNTTAQNSRLEAVPEG